MDTAVPHATGSLPSDRYDVAIIGGGINGTGVARDLSLRGLRVVLFERHDLAFGASGNSSGMIHGGVRYLQSNPSVTEQSCRDSGYIQRIAPHLLFRIPFLLPLRRGAKGRVMIELIDAYFTAYDRYQPLKHGERHTRLDASELARLEPGIVGDVTGAITFDEWGVDGTRLCVMNAIDAIEHGAQVHTHSTVEGLTRGDGEAPASAGWGDWVLDARDMLSARTLRVRAKVVVNATGAWSPVTASLGGLQSRVRPGKGIHVVYDRRLSNYGILSDAIDGRQIFLMPWQNVSTIGTTDDDYYGDMDHVIATSEEVRYLVQGVARVFPSVREARAIGTYAGVRPTLFEYGKLEDALSREHEIVEHAGVPGVYSMIGGKLASFRIFAQEMSDRIARDLAPSTTCTTHEKSLPGGENVPDALELSDAHGLSPIEARRLVYRHGSRSLKVIQRFTKAPDERAVVCPCEPVIDAEVRHVVRNELARTVMDVSRRTRLGLGACGGMRCAARCAQIVADELGFPPTVAHAQALEFLTQQARARIPALGPDQARQESLALAHHHATLGMK